MRPRFVIHKHLAKRAGLHWDLRLEMDGVLKSWVLRKEPPAITGVKRLAIEVEDHDIDYLYFEGEIPDGFYGAGTVEIWDRGTYVLKKRGKNTIVFFLDGGRLRGTYVLRRMEGRRWLFFRIS
ncbi:MAG: DNA polymerase ligase N-terminal domain-containing protein [Candidatus Baldrarchaeia archaeon]